MARVYLGDLFEIDFADGQPMLSSLRPLCFDELEGNPSNGGPISDGSMLYEAVKPRTEVVVLDRANGSKSVMELSIVVDPSDSEGLPVRLLVRIAGLLMLAVGALGLVIGWRGSLPPQSMPR